MDPTDLQRTFRHAPGSLLVLRPDADFTIVAASQQYLRGTGRDEGILGRPLFEVFPHNPEQPEDAGAHALTASLRRVIETRKPHSMGLTRYDLRRPDSQGGAFEEYYWLPTNAPILGEDGQVEFLIHQAEDPSAKHSRSAVQILENISEGFFALDRQWRFDYANRAAHRILHREPGDLVGRVLWEEYPGLEDTDIGRAYRRAMAERHERSLTLFYPPRGRWYDATVAPVPEGIAVYFRDVTGRERAQAERERIVAASDSQRRIYETALDNTPDFVYVFDLEHRVLYANHALLSLWGVADARGMGWLDLGYSPETATRHDQEIDEVVRRRAPLRGEIPYQTPEGRRMYDYIFAPVLDPDGKVVAVAGTTRDITEREAAEEALREHAARLAESDRAKDEFLATLSHELRNPLAPLRNSVELLRMLGGADHESAPIHAIMTRQVDHLVRLVDDLLEMSRISRGTLSLRREPVEVASIVRNAVETSEPLIRAGKHELWIELPQDALWLEGDPVRLAQILGNLLNNAARYTEDGGRIGVRAWREDGHVVIGVSDTGVGMTPEAVPRMFEMFSRGDRDSSRSQGGLGIGLALSRRLAEMHDGTLEATSPGPGKGSEFRLRLPLPTGAPGTAPPPAMPAPDLAQRRVLVVDDNHDAGDSLAHLLRLLGVDVMVVRDGPQALDAFVAYRPSVVLLDIGMPGMNGYEVARTLRARFPASKATLVALTGWGQEEDRQRALEAGFDHHLLKPAELGDLQRLLSSLPPADG